MDANNQNRTPLKAENLAQVPQAKTNLEKSKTTYDRAEGFFAGNASYAYSTSTRQQKDKYTDDLLRIIQGQR